MFEHKCFFVVVVKQQHQDYSISPPLSSLFKTWRRFSLEVPTFVRQSVNCELLTPQNTFEKS